jgi:hypothetical protein
MKTQTNLETTMETTLKTTFKMTTILVGALLGAACSGHTESDPAGGAVVIVPRPGDTVVTRSVSDAELRAPLRLPPDSPFVPIAAEEVAAKLPASPGARVLAPWAHPGDADFFVSASFCVDGENTAQASEGVAADLRRAGWQAVEAGAPPEAERVELSATDGPYLLSGFVAPGAQPDCDGARGQLLVAAAVRKQR